MMRKLVFLVGMMSLTAPAFGVPEENLEAEMEAAEKLNRITQESDISQMKRDIAQLKRDVDDLKRDVRELR